MLTNEDLQAISDLFDKKFDEKFDEKIKPIQHELSSLKNEKHDILLTMSELVDKRGCRRRGTGSQESRCRDNEKAVAGTSDKAESAIAENAARRKAGFLMWRMEVCFAAGKYGRTATTWHRPRSTDFLHLKELVV